jgi:hypothetical protein
MENLKKIEQYLRGELEEDDLWEFKRALETDPQLASDLRSYIELKKMMVQTKKIDMMEKLQTIHENEQKKRRFLGLPVYSAVAAALLLLAAVGGGILIMQSGNQQQKLFEQYYTSESGSFALRSGNSTIDQPVMQGLQFYESGDYTSAVKMFNMSSENLMSKLYRGLSFVELADYNSAILDFQAIIDHNDNLFVDQANWYLALCYLRTNQSDKANEQLNNISSGRSIYKTKAQKILKELEDK